MFLFRFYFIFFFFSFFSFGDDNLFVFPQLALKTYVRIYYSEGEPLLHTVSMRYVYAEGSRNCWSERDWEEETIAAGPSEKKKNFFHIM
jgi:hypothetical protein